MELVDTHCHIHEAGDIVEQSETHEHWQKGGKVEPDKMIAEAKAYGVNRIICVGTGLEDSRLAIDFAKNRPNCRASIGIHPHEAKKYVGKKALLEEFSKLATEPKVVAVGECGLDYFYEHSPREAQIELLKFQIELALKSNLPLIFHVRDAFDHFWPVFENYKNLRGVLHSFTDSRRNMELAVEHGLYIGVNGIATFTKNPAQLEVYKAIPVKNLLLETDAPFLTPTPYRGTINEPKHVRVVAEFLSGLRGEGLEQLAKATTKNAFGLFGLD